MATQLEFELDDGSSAFMLVAETDQNQNFRLAGRNDGGISEKATKTFSEAISSITPIGQSLLAKLKDINQPSEIGLEFNIRFNAEAGVVFTSVASEASFKVNIVWKHKDSPASPYFTKKRSK